mmetsp:Transcript_22702/g.68132  ORF Transcript_22702/g.68132 Transcript_22702/m.68132 type:complete len:164 (+) Transcript_22702:173-664(+)
MAALNCRLLVPRTPALDAGRVSGCPRGRAEAGGRGDGRAPDEDVDAAVAEPCAWRGRGRAGAGEARGDRIAVCVREDRGRGETFYVVAAIGYIVVRVYGYLEGGACRTPPVLSFGKGRPSGRARRDGRAPEAQAAPVPGAPRRRAASHLSRASEPSDTCSPRP